MSRGITVETEEAGPLTVTPDQIPVPVRGGKGKSFGHRIKAVRQTIRLVDWDEVERIEATGGKVTPDTTPYIDPTAPPKPKPAVISKTGSLFDR